MTDFADPTAETASASADDNARTTDDLSIPPFLDRTAEAPTPQQLAEAYDRAAKLGLTVNQLRIIVQRGRVMSVKTSINKLNDAMDAMRRPGSRMIQTNYHGRPDFWITPSGGLVEPDIAKRIIAHPQVIGGRDALFPGHHQTWRMRLDDDSKAV